MNALIKSYLAVALVALGTSGQAWPQGDAREVEGTLTSSQQELAEARRALEQAAREVARLSAEIAAPVARDLNVRFWRPLARARLGVNIESTDAGARVVGVTPGSGAADAGIVTGDVIVAIDGVALTDGGDRSPVEMLVTAMEDVDPEEGVLVSVERDGEVEELTVLPQPAEYRWFRGAPGSRVDFTLPDLGNLPRVFSLPGVFTGPFRELELVSLTPGLGEYFGTDTGLLVVRAPQDEQLQLEDGDVILEIGNRTPTSPEHAMRILASFEPGETLRLTIMRRERRETLEFEFPEP